MDRRSFINKAGVAGAAAAATTVAAPAIAQGRKEMVIVSSWGRDFPGLGTSAQRFAKRLTDVTDGRITVKYFAAGERVGAFDVFDEVASGNAQAYISAEYYWKGKHPGFGFFTSVPFGLTYAEQAAWIFHLGGQKLWDELSDGFGLKALPVGNTGVQMGGWFNKEIETADDLKGLKMRIPGLGGDVMAKVGASPVSLPGGQIYENLVSGAIDATEWVGPYNDYFLKFYEAAKYYYYPGMHEPGGYVALGMNKSWWSGLSKTDQLLIQARRSPGSRPDDERAQRHERGVPAEAGQGARREAARVQRRDLRELRQGGGGGVRGDACAQRSCQSHLRELRRRARERCRLAEACRRGLLAQAQPGPGYLGPATRVDPVGRGVQRPAPPG